MIERTGSDTGRVIASHGGGTDIAFDIDGNCILIDGYTSLIHHKLSSDYQEQFIGEVSGVMDTADDRGYHYDKSRGQILLVGMFDEGKGYKFRLNLPRL